MPDHALLFKEVSGIFYRTVPEARLDRILAPPPAGSAGRYHRPGEPTLYTSAARDWSVQAVAGYMREDRLTRYVVPLRIDPVLVLDQHDEAVCLHFGIDRDLSNEPWRDALASGREPASWRNADIARASGACGIIDRSRKIPGGWHLNLFRWNDLGGPRVEVCGDPVRVVWTDDGPKLDQGLA
ncbi:MAG: RES domain-containing protein [Rhodobacteraceae bacterium]|nr:RES domain-containing protein [Paracoccaceae bacterium]